jgi:hypothetical protein
MHILLEGEFQIAYSVPFTTVTRVKTPNKWYWYWLMVRDPNESVLSLQPQVVLFRRKSLVAKNARVSPHHVHL